MKNFEANIEKLHEVLCLGGYTSTKQVFTALECPKDSFAYASVFNLFDLDNKLPKIIPAEQFELLPSVKLFSGCKNLTDISNNFQKGKFRTREQHDDMGFGYGLGYYFTKSKELAETFASTPNDIIIAKFSDTAKTIHEHELDEICQDKFDFSFETHQDLSTDNQISVNNSFQKKKEIVRDVFCMYNAFRTAMATMFEYDAIEYKVYDYPYGYVVANRSSLVLPQSPEVTL